MSRLSSRPRPPRTAHERQAVAAIVASARALDVAAGLPACVHCGCTASAACPGGCAWISLDPPVCSAPACTARGVPR